MESTKKIIIVEDNDLFRAALRDLINAQEHLEVVAEAGSVAEALKTVKRVPADLILLDLRLPDASGLEVLPEIPRREATKVLVLTIFESGHNIDASFEAGADGYCFKDVSSQELLKAIFCVLAGERYAPRAAQGYPNERRGERRHACDFNLVWVYFNKTQTAPGRMLNCSRTGCYFESSQKVAAPSTVLIRLEEPLTGARKASREPVGTHTVVEVKWCLRRNHRYGAGARYHVASYT
jgi:CheY-like chemotaxis protein